jgi:hypothetical protein
LLCGQYQVLYSVGYLSLFLTVTSSFWFLTDLEIKEPLVLGFLKTCLKEPEIFMQKPAKDWQFEGYLTDS